jgi:hypothetical protein
VDTFDAELAACMMIPPPSRRAYRNRLAGVRQLLFETRVIDTPRIKEQLNRGFADAPTSCASSPTATPCSAWSAPYR